jgi:predicted alpha/beta hydrolase family esterase
MHDEKSSRKPIILTVPGLNGSGPGHWQTLWEQERDDCERLELGMWDNPRRNVWIARIDQAVRAADAPIILAAHSLGCVAVAWWATLAGQPWGTPIAGALLVAPPDVNRADARDTLRGFGPAPCGLLPFPSIVVASENDPYITLQRAFDLAQDWGSHFLNIGEAGHINANSGLGRWSEGQALLSRLVDVAEEQLLPDNGQVASRSILADRLEGSRPLGARGT